VPACRCGAGCLDDAPEPFHEEATRKRQVQKAEKDSVLVEARGSRTTGRRCWTRARTGRLPRSQPLRVWIWAGQSNRPADLLVLDIVEVWLTGEDNGLALAHLIRGSLPADWGGQRQALSVPMV
jgi:hypothetical protein